MTPPRSPGPATWPPSPANRSSRWPGSHTTVSIERAVLRMAGLEGADVEGIPWVNRLVDSVAEQVGLDQGVALPVWDALAAQRRAGVGTDAPLLTLAQRAAAGSVEFRQPEGRAATSAATAARSGCPGGCAADGQAARGPREAAHALPGGPQAVDLPDRGHRQHRRGRPAGAGCRARGRRHHRGDPLDRASRCSTSSRRAPRTEGYAGTYATQENFRIMRRALDDVSRELGRYVRLTNYASGLCMPEIATLAGLERLDMMLNDSMYGILFRDINPVRTFTDQHFARQVHARAGIIINTGEDNYLTTADAVDAAHTVTVSQLLNEYFAKEAGLADWQLGLGPRLRDQPRDPGLVPPGAGPRAAGPRAVPRCAAEVDAAHEAHDWRHLPRVPARRLLQPGRSADRPGDPARRDDDRGRGHALAQRPGPGPAERAVRAGRRQRAG